MSISSSILQKYMDDSGVFRVTLFPTCLLRPHEEYIKGHVEEVKSGVIVDGFWTRPMIVDFFTGIVLDGHHRNQLTQLEELKYVPVVLVNYTSPEITIYEGDSDETMSHEIILKSVNRGDLLPKKFTRHQFSGRLTGVKEATCKVPMSALL